MPIPHPQYVVIWEFRIHSGCEVAFERAYGPDGDWARLFRKGEGYLGTDLLQDDADGAHRYLTIDRWESEAAFTRFKSRYLEEYHRLDQDCEGLTAEERLLGAFSLCP